MVSLQDFKSYPGPGETSILEKDGRLSSMPVSEVQIGAYEHPIVSSKLRFVYRNALHKESKLIA